MPQNFQKKILKNGITLLFEKRNLPIISVSITNKFGAAYEESKIKGIAHLIEHLLFTGTKTRTHEDISREIEKRGGVLNAFTTHELTSFWFKLPSEHIFSGLDILTDILLNPTFKKEKFEKEKKIILEEIKMYQDNPRTAIFQQIEKNLFEPPFGNLIIGSKETVSALQRNFVVNYFKEMYSPENYIVTLVGKADFKKVCEYLENKFKKENKKLSLQKIKKKNAHSIEKRPGIDQAHFVFALHGPLPNEKNFYTLQVLDAYLASGMSSRLFLEIREKRGLAYTVLSSIDAEKNYSTYSIYTGTTKEAIEEVKSIILQEFNNIQKMTEQNLKEAKERLIGLKRVLSEESTNVMTQLTYSELTGNALKYYQFDTKVNEVKLEEVKKLSQSLIKNYSTAIIIPDN